MQALILALYWLSLATWFGCVLMSAIAPLIILRITKEADPTLPRVLSVNLDSQHSTLLASMIVGDLLATLFRLEAACAIVLLPSLIGQWFLVERSGPAVVLPILVSGLYVGAVACLVYTWRVVLAKVLEHRAKYIEHADDPDAANAELDAFDRYGQTLFSMVRNLLFALLGMILFSANFMPHAEAFSAH